MVGLSVLAMPVTPYAQQHEDVIFTLDVAPVLQRACQVCHRPGSTVPMSLLSYADDGSFVSSADVTVSVQADSSSSVR